MFSTCISALDTITPRPLPTRPSLPLGLARAGFRCLDPKSPNGCSALWSRQAGRGHLSFGVWLLPLATQPNVQGRLTSLGAGRGAPRPACGVRGGSREQGVPGANAEGETGLSPGKRTAKGTPGGGNTEENRVGAAAGGRAAVALPAGGGARQVPGERERGAACGAPSSPAQHLSQPWSGCGAGRGGAFALRAAAGAIRDETLRGLRPSLLPAFVSMSAMTNRLNYPPRPWF